MRESFLAHAMNVHGDAVYRLAICRLQNVADAEDVFQETFLQLLKEKRAVNWDEEHVKAWLLRVAINKCSDIGRRRQTCGTIALEDVPELSAEDTFRYAEIWDAVSRLPDRIRTIFHLFYAEGYQTDEIAKLLNIPASTVRVYLNRARKILRKELSDDDVI